MKTPSEKFWNWFGLWTGVMVGMGLLYFKEELEVRRPPASRQPASETPAQPVRPLTAPLDPPLVGTRQMGSASQSLNSPSTHFRRPLPAYEFLASSQVPATVHSTADGRPFRLNGEWPLAGSADRGGKPLLEFLHQASLALQFDHPEQLEYDGVVAGAHIFKQRFKGLSVEGAQVRVFVNDKNMIYLVNSTYTAQIENLEVAPQVEDSQATRKILQHAAHFDPGLRGTTLRPPELVIRKSLTGPLLAWKVIVSQPELGASHGSSVYYVDARTLELDRIEKAIQ